MSDRRAVPFASGVMRHERPQTSPVGLRPREFRLEPGDVVQLDPQCGSPVAGSFMTVDEVHPWGAVGHVPTGPNMSYKARASWSEMEFAGRATWVYKGVL